MRILSRHSQHSGSAAVHIAERERLQEIRFRFHQHVAADNATIRNAVRHIDWNVHWLHEDEPKAARLIFYRQTTRREHISGVAQTGIREQLERSSLQSSFGNGDRQLRHCVTSPELISTRSPRMRLSMTSEKSAERSLLSTTRWTFLSDGAASIAALLPARSRPASASKSSTKPTAGSDLPKLAVKLS